MHAIADDVHVARAATGGDRALVDLAVVPAKSSWSSDTASKFCLASVIGASS